MFRNVRIMVLMLYKYLESNCISIPEISLDSQYPIDMFGGDFVGQCSPLFRWVGGKTQLLPAVRFYAPKKFDTYFEPFLGGGALLFNLMPERAVVNDVNSVLINLYRDVRDNYERLVTLLRVLSNVPDTEQTFYDIRRMFNAYLKGTPCVEMSALFFYLNSKCFNGVYRVNSNGEFNVSYAKESRRPCVYVPETLQYAHDYFSSNQVEFLCGDFLKCTEKAKEGDFVYFDPPYVPVSENKNFDRYSSDGFGVQDQERLATEFKRLDSIGVKCLLSNSETPLVHELYKDYIIKSLSVNYYVQPISDNIHRSECLIKNF